MDIFSLGCVMYEVCQLRRAYADEKRISSPAVTGPYDEHTKAAIHACLILRKTQRASLSGLAAHLNRGAPAAKQPAKPPQAPLAGPKPARPSILAAPRPVVPRYVHQARPQPLVRYNPMGAMALRQANPLPAAHLVRGQPVAMYNPGVAKYPQQVAPIQQDASPSECLCATCGLLGCCCATAMCCTVM